MTNVGGRCEKGAVEQRRQRPSEFELPGRRGRHGLLRAALPVPYEGEECQGRERDDRHGVEDKGRAGTGDEQAEEAEAGCQPDAQGGAGRHVKQDPRRPLRQRRCEGEGQERPDRGGNGQGQQDQERHGFESFR